MIRMSYLSASERGANPPKLMDYVGKILKKWGYKVTECKPCIPCAGIRENFRISKKVEGAGPPENSGYALKPKILALIVEDFYKSEGMLPIPDSTLGDMNFERQVKNGKEIVVVNITSLEETPLKETRVTSLEYKEKIRNGEKQNS